MTAGLDGNLVAFSPGAAGRNANVFINSGYSFDLKGLYQVAPDRPWGFDVAAVVHGREGYPVGYHASTSFADGRGALRELLLDQVDDVRYDDVLLVDARIEKKFAFDDWALTVAAEAFNLLDENTVLQRQANVRSGFADSVTEVVGARTLRVGVRLSFR